jgi:nitrite reductase/ring-hydroxylating ferredoxin subunit/Fe-S cluster biogenesis protein NfuA
MYGLVRADLATRVSRVVEMLRPHIRSQGGDVELVEVSGGTARIRLAGACNGCSMPAQALRDNFEEALKHNVPEIRSIEVVPADPTPVLIPVESLTAHSSPGWIAGPRLDSLTDGELFRLDQGKASILIVRLGNRVQAFRNECAHQGLPLDGGIVDREAGTITCPWHGFRYDCLTGECLTAPQAQLEPLPVRIENGIVQVRPL